MPVAVWMWGTETKATLSEVERNMDQICLKQLSGGLRPDYEESKEIGAEHRNLDSVVSYMVIAGETGRFCPWVTGKPSNDCWRLHRMCLQVTAARVAPQHRGRQRQQRRGL